MPKLTDPDEINKALSRCLQKAAADFLDETGVPCLLAVVAHDGTRLYISANEAALDEPERIARMFQRAASKAIDQEGYALMLRVWHFTVKNIPTTVAVKQRDGSAG
jgi:hypothetical protein